MTTFLIQSNQTNDQEARRFTLAAQELCPNVRFIKYIPFGNTDYASVLEGVKGPVVFYGSISLIKDFQERGTRQHPFAWCDWDRLSCHSYYAEYGGLYMLQQEYGFYPLAEVWRKQTWLYRTYGHDGRIFIRPDSNDKAFHGEVVHERLMHDWYSQVTEYEPPNNLLCVVSRPEHILAEWRLVLADKKVITGSMYKKDGALDLRPPAYDKLYDRMVSLAEGLAEHWQPHPIFVMDVAQTEDGWLKVLEVGPINAAGLYKCDMRPVVRKMMEIAEREYEERNTLC